MSRIFPKRAYSSAAFGRIVQTANQPIPDKRLDPAGTICDLRFENTVWLEFFRHMLLRLLECCFYVVCVAMLPEADSPRSEKRERERERERREGKGRGGKGRGRGRWSSGKFTRYCCWWRQLGLQGRDQFDVSCCAGLLSYPELWRGAHCGLCRA
ncbi:hypothetical protein NA56DRAFT_147506 [Hyaloscypha hepaticicola]|uniref:Uncharacterized protein n=1 Tax=Hyaloscypha hepaticicola TaxID=2082293 RepID=A0A2J6QNF2_9HELO|nr:hypothetical protein NA56DRAFT_147506 [Hyaloscypha hepaticicola]